MRRVYDKSCGLKLDKETYKRGSLGEIASVRVTGECIDRRIPPRLDVRLRDAERR